VGNIVVLPPELASQIAAGEVVERPASVVKELVENAIDGNAKRCDVEIEGGGITLVRVTDDGEGMLPEDATRCIERHATSKLRSFDDLKRVSSFGFRGEALPSIASVSRFSLQTRAAAASEGLQIDVEGAGRVMASPVGVPVGTTATVRDLFFNVPARRKFLRSSNTESGHVTEVLEAAALARPGVTFTLKRDGRHTRELLRAPSREERVRQWFGDASLAPCRGQRGPLVVEAFLSRPERSRTGAGGLKLLVNGRVVKDRALAVTVAHAYGSVLERGRYPRGVVYLELPPELIDVNVHPQKAEVRFADPRAVTDAVYAVLARALADAFSMPAPTRSQWTPRAAATEDEPRQPTPDTGDGSRPQTAPQVETLSAETTLQSADPWGLVGDADPSASATTAAASPSSRSLASSSAATGALIVHDSAGAPLQPRPGVRWADLRFVAQVRQTYLVCESEDGLYVLDQHAASERVNFDRLVNAYRTRSVPSQSLLFPVVLPVSAAEADLAESHAEQIAALGVEVRLRSADALSVHAVPRLLQDASPERLVRDLLTELSRGGGRGFSDAVDRALATLACHGSLRAGDPVGPNEARALLTALDDAKFAGHCPHGRPVVAFTSWVELERKVGRR